MDIRKLIAELLEIASNPRAEYVDVQGPQQRLIFRFFQANPYYFPLGILRVCLGRDGAGVIYVYTTQNDYPHLTIPFDGVNIHWTVAPGDNREVTQAPQSIQRFLNLFQ